VGRYEKYADYIGVPEKPRYGGYKLDREKVAAITLGQQVTFASDRERSAHVCYALLPRFAQYLRREEWL